MNEFGIVEQGNLVRFYLPKIAEDVHYRIAPEDEHRFTQVLWSPAVGVQAEIYGAQLQYHEGQERLPLLDELGIVTGRLIRELHIRDEAYRVFLANPEARELLHYRWESGKAAEYFSSLFKNMAEESDGSHSAVRVSYPYALSYEYEEALEWAEETGQCLVPASLAKGEYRKHLQAKLKEARGQIKADGEIEPDVFVFEDMPGRAVRERKVAVTMDKLEAILSKTEYEWGSDAIARDSVSKRGAKVKEKFGI